MSLYFGQVNDTEKSRPQCRCEYIQQNGRQCGVCIAYLACLLNHVKVGFADMLLIQMLPAELK